MIFIFLGIVILVVSFIIAFISLMREQRGSVNDQEISGPFVIDSKNPALSTNMSDGSQLNLQSTEIGSNPNLSSISKGMQPSQAQEPEDIAKTASFPWEQQASFDLERKPGTSDEQGLEPTAKLRGVISIKNIVNKREI